MTKETVNSQEKDYSAYGVPAPEQEKDGHFRNGSLGFTAGISSEK